MDKCVLGGNSIPQGAWTPLLEEKLIEAPLIASLDYCVRLISLYGIMHSTDSASYSALAATSPSREGQYSVSQSPYSLLELRPIFDGEPIHLSPGFRGVEEEDTNPTSYGATVYILMLLSTVKADR
jgi:hypothetical protein